MRPSGGEQEHWTLPSALAQPQPWPCGNVLRAMLSTLSSQPLPGCCPPVAGTGYLSPCGHQDFPTERWQDRIFQGASQKWTPMTSILQTLTSMADQGPESPQASLPTSKSQTVLNRVSRRDKCLSFKQETAALAGTAPTRRAGRLLLALQRHQVSWEAAPHTPGTPGEVTPDASACRGTCFEAWHHSLWCSRAVVRGQRPSWRRQDSASAEILMEETH